MTMAVLEANGKPIPVAPNPQPAPTLSKIPHESFLIFSGGKASSRCPIQVCQDPGTLSYIPSLTHCHHGTPLSTHKVLTANQPPNSPFKLWCQSAQQQQLTNNDWQCSIPHQHQTQDWHHPIHAQCTMLANWPELHNNKSQEINDNSILNGIYITGTQLQHVITTSYPDCFTLIVHDSCQKYSKPTLTPSSYNSRISTRTTNQQLIPQNHHDLITLSDTTGLPACRSIIHEHCNDNRPHENNQTHTANHTKN